MCKTLKIQKKQHDRLKMLALMRGENLQETSDVVISLGIAHAIDTYKHENAEQILALAESILEKGREYRAQTERSNGES